MMKTNQQSDENDKAGGWLALQIFGVQFKDLRGIHYVMRHGSRWAWMWLAGFRRRLFIDQSHGVA